MTGDHNAMSPMSNPRADMHRRAGTVALLLGFHTWDRGVLVDINMHECDKQQKGGGGGNVLRSCGCNVRVVVLVHGLTWLHGLTWSSTRILPAAGCVGSRLAGTALVPEPPALLVDAA